MRYLFMFILLGVLVFLHELGHLIAAKICRIPLTRFSVGLGRKVWGFRMGGTEYCVSLFPFGGYVLPALQEDELQDLPLDGGRIVMAILQRLYAPLRRLQLPFALAGWVLLLAVMVYTTVLDISRLVVAITS